MLSWIRWGVKVLRRGDSLPNNNEFDRDWGGVREWFAMGGSECRIRFGFLKPMSSSKSVIRREVFVGVPSIRSVE